MKNIHILFVCSANVDRSPTAMHLYARTPGIETKSAGISSYATVPITSELIKWAELILCMEDWQLLYIQRKFNDSLSGKVSGNLDIPDEYPFMHPKLITIIKKRMIPWLRKYDLIKTDV